MILLAIFYLSWLLLLIGIFILSREVLYKYTNHINFSRFGSLFTTIAILFEAILMLEERKWMNDNWITNLSHFLFPRTKSNHWRWHVNPITVPFSLLGRLIVLSASIFGQSIGSFVGHLFDELPFFVSFCMFPFTMLCIIIGILALFGYQFNIGYGFIKVSSQSTNSRFRTFLKSDPDIPKVDKKVLSKFDCCIKKVNESYQKVIR